MNLRWWVIWLALLAVLLGSGTVALASRPGFGYENQQVWSNDSANRSSEAVTIAGGENAGSSKGSGVGAWLADHALGLAKGVGVGLLAAGAVVLGAAVIGVVGAPLAVMAGAAIIGGALYGLFTGSARFNFWEAFVTSTIGAVSAGVGGWLAGAIGKTVLAKVAVAAVDIVGSGLASTASYLITNDHPTLLGSLSAFGLGAGFAGAFMGAGAVATKAWGAIKSLSFVDSLVTNIRVPVRNAIGRLQFWMTGIDPNSEVQSALRALDAGVYRTPPIQEPVFVKPPIPEIKGPSIVTYSTGEEAYAALGTAPVRDGRFRYAGAPQFMGELQNMEPGFVLRSGALEEDLLLVQLHADVPLGRGRSAKYWTTVDQANAYGSLDDYREFSALDPEWEKLSGPRVQISVARVPKGAEVDFAIGHAAPQESKVLRRILPGGGIQILFADFDPSWIRTTQKVR